MKTILILLISLTLHSCAVADFYSHRDNICEVHNIPMKKAVVRIHYGRAGLMKEYEGLTLYPNMKKKALGGCVRRYGKLAKVYYCKSCNKARREYRKHNN